MDKPSCSSSSSPYYGTQEGYMVDRPDESKCFGMKVDTETAKAKKRKVTDEEREEYTKEK
ncbi:hypothetical protein [Endozoicomonas sp. 8E]|uniref:hypothetical protein n=1 Tax=Endozoicomonas sp. 8E TaxID=3035692 RepID=UPI002939537C|nr:hypothetical protein [Endozoicomonas sp. 8E]WOG25883.1 hypothetical protein P6910_15020 [Endozoicomonas sp. 8E]